MRLEPSKHLLHWNDTEVEYPNNLCIHELFEQQVERNPDALALRFGEKELSYRELDNWANQVAHHLIGLGVGAEQVVGVYLERSLELVVALMAVLKAGGAYLPLEPSYPTERLELMMGECDTRVIVTNGSLAKRLPIGDRTIVCLDDSNHGIGSNPTTAPKKRGNSENLAYVIYTSGSTGRPKGVAETHRAVVNFLNWCVVTFPMDHRDVFLQIAPFTFDASVFELFTALISGAKLLLIRQGGQREPDYLVKMMLLHGVTVASFVPPTLRMVLEEDGFPEVSTLRRAFCGGEAMPLDLMVRFHYRSEAELVNLYGPTEVSVYCAGWVCERNWREGTPPIGKPIFNTQIYILGEMGGILGAGETGEIYVGGEGLARGYINHPDITAERFVPNPFSNAPDSRLYRTGDLGFWNPNGIISFVGRVDDQIKLRGFRIEPAEIEMALARIPEIAQALVVCREDEPGNQQLVAYCIPAVGEKIPSVPELRRSLGRFVPEYMIPSVYVAIDEFPLNANGKRDRKSLPPPRELLDQDGEAKFRRMPKDLLEQRLLEIWRKVLGRKNIGIHDNFFDLGGHSLTAAILTHEIEKLAYRRLPTAVFFQAPSVAELGAYLKKNQDDPAWSALVPLQPSGKRTPLFVMHGMGGDVFAYIDLARFLGPNQPVYGLQAIGLDGSNAEHLSIEEMAAHYADQIRALQPTGPYNLFGYSLGGWIAYAVADQLIKKGGVIGLFIALDTEPEAKVDLRLRLRQHVDLHLEQAFQQGRGVGPLFSYVAQWFARKGSKYFEKKKEVSAPASGIGTDHFELLCKNYVPPKLPVRVNLFIPQERKLWQIKFWHYYALQGVNIHPLFACHLDFIDPANAAELAEVVRCLLEEARGN